MYQNYQNTLVVPAALLYEDLALLSYDNYKQWCARGKINKILTGGNGRKALVEFASLPQLFRVEIKRIYGDPFKSSDLDALIARIRNNPETYVYFENYRGDNGKGLLPERIAQYYAEAQILEVYEELVKDLNIKKHNGIRINLGPAKKEICAVIQELGTLEIEGTGKLKFPHRLPKNYRALDYKLQQYQQFGLESLVPKSIGNNNSRKIKGQAAEWIIATYCLPNKPVVPVVHMEYMRVRTAKGWPTLSESAIAKWLEEPKQKKVWFLARHGVQEWRNKYGHKLSRDKSDWFPNAYWAIDGSKLDWAHFKDNAQGMGADIKIDVVFDVYSEQIIGYSFSQTETHADHFKAIKMAVNRTGKKPFLFTYDGQSGHTTKEMQALYSNLVAKNGGKHYKHAARQHGSPVEQLFSRFQQQVLNTKWFSDKQSIKSRKLDSQPNMEFLIEQKHNLRKIEDLEKAFEACVEQWNQNSHPKFNEARATVYNTHQELLSEPISMFEQMDLFWVSTKDARTYESSGITPIISNTKYHFEVYDENGEVDIEFRDQYTGCKFFVQYDPDQLDNYVRLFLKLPNGNRQFIKDAQPKRLTKQIPALMDTEAKAQMWKDRQVRKTELDRTQQKIKDLQKSTGITPEQLIEDQELNIKLGGNLPKEERSALEAASWLNRM